MFQALAQALREGGATRVRSEAGRSAQDAAQERDKFNEHLRRDASEVVSKLVLHLNKELTEVVDEMVLQGNDFWRNQLQRQEEQHQEEVAALRADVADAQKQLDETVQMYNEVVKRLNTQLEESHEQLDIARKVAVAKTAAAAQQHLSQETAKEESNRSTLQELQRQLAATQAASHDASLRAQQKRLVLVQTVEKQHREIEDLKLQLKKAEARDAKLTSVSEHLLVKQASMVAQIKELQDQLAGYKKVSADVTTQPSTSQPSTPRPLVPVLTTTTEDLALGSRDHLPASIAAPPAGASGVGPSGTAVPANHATSCDVATDPSAHTALDSVLLSESDRDPPACASPNLSMTALTKHNKSLPDP